MFWSERPKTEYIWRRERESPTPFIKSLLGARPPSPPPIPADVWPTILNREQRGCKHYCLRENTRFQWSQIRSVLEFNEVVLHLDVSLSQVGHTAIPPLLRSGNCGHDPYYVHQQRTTSALVWHAQLLSLNASRQVIMNGWEVTNQRLVSKITECFFLLLLSMFFIPSQCLSPHSSCTWI